MTLPGLFYQAAGSATLHARTSPSSLPQDISCWLERQDAPKHLLLLLLLLLMPMLSLLLMAGMA
jgi:hypothetical protein